MRQKKDGNKSPALEAGGSGKEGNSGSQASQQQQVQAIVSSDSQEASTAENTATTDSTTATTDKAYTNSTDTTVANAAKQVETDNSSVQKAEGDLKTAIDNVNTAANSKDFNETTFETAQTAEQKAETALETAENKLTQDQQTLETDLQDQKKAPTSTTPPAKEGPSSSGSGSTPSSSGNSVASQLVKDTTTVNNLKSVSVSGMNTTLSGVETMSKQTATISALLNSSTDLSSVISNAQGLSSAFGALESAQNTLKGYLDSSSATIGQLTNSSNAVVSVLDKAINQVDTALADLVTTDTQKTQAVTLATTGSSANSTTTDAIAFLNALKTNLMAQKDAFMNVHKNIQTAVAQAQATYKPSVMNTNNYGQMYGVDAMAGYKWFFGKTKRFGFRTYGYYSYNHANLSFVGSKLGIMEGASQVNNFAYGVGFDALYNFYESKDGYNTAGLFLGFGLGGDSFIVQGESYLKSQMQICNNTAGCSASMNTSYFQMPVEFGFRSNFSKHSGIEVGFKLPLFTNQFYKERGVDGSVDVFYKRNFSIYFNYMINF
ncbi:membrane protein [Helicobacter pylori]|nr:membrane protein [Helicobacter pylori]GHS40722.1 membrane protein [Helicobacter pylori]